MKLLFPLKLCKFKIIYIYYFSNLFLVKKEITFGVEPLTFGCTNTVF
jgi:hypothetical protein